MESDFQKEVFIDMNLKMKRLVALLVAALLLLCATALAQQEIDRQEITLPLGTRFYPKASFPQMKNYRILSQPEGRDVEHGWSWLRLSKAGEYLLEGYGADGAPCLELSIRAAEDAPALLGAVIAGEDQLPGLRFHFASDAPGVLRVWAEEEVGEVAALDENVLGVSVTEPDGSVLGNGEVHIDLADGEAKDVLLCTILNGAEVKVPARVSLAYPCAACGESPLSAAYGHENHVIGYCGHWLCLETGDVHNHKCVCGEYLCNGADHSGCACPGCGAYIRNGESHAVCRYCGLRACDESYGDPTQHIPCPHCGDVQCTLGWTSVPHEPCPLCGLWPCDDAYGYPSFHTLCPGCGIACCSAEYQASPYAHTFDPYCDRYVCAPGHPALCPYCFASPCSPNYSEVSHDSLCDNCGQHDCLMDHGFCKGCGKQLCDTDFVHSEHRFCNYCSMMICEPGYVAAEHDLCPVCDEPLCRGDHSVCAPEPTVEPTPEPTVEPTAEPTAEPAPAPETAPEAQ